MGRGKALGRKKTRPTRSPKVKTKPTRVTVASPSGREGRTISVSSRSILARGRKSPPSRPTPIGRPTFVSDLIPFQSQDRPTKRPLIFETFTPPERRRTGARGRSEEREERAPSFVPRGRRKGIEEEGSDFDVLNFFA